MADPSNDRSLINEAQTARVKAHIRAIFSRLLARAQKIYKNQTANFAEASVWNVRNSVQGRDRSDYWLRRLSGAFSLSLSHEFYDRTRYGAEFVLQRLRRQDPGLCRL